jgi:hypothetical protein
MDETKTVTTDQHTFVVQFRPKDRDRTWKFGKVRVFVSGEDEPTFDHPGFGSVRGDGSDEDRAWKRYNREELRLQRELVAQAYVAVPELAADLGGLSFSRKAGCSCGCFPGFIAEGRGTQDVWVTRTPATPTFQVADRVEHVDGRVGEVTQVGPRVVVKFDEDSVPQRYFAWNLADRDLTKVGVVVPDPNEAWLAAGQVTS